MAVDQIARRLLAAGISCIPVKTDGSKSPAISSWKEFEQRQPTESEVSKWPTNAGIAVIGGEVSGNLGILDIEYQDYFELFSGLLADESPGLLEKLPRIETPGRKDGPGTHLYFRAECKIKTQKLAALPPAIAEERTGTTNKHTAIEIKAEGGYVLTVGCPAECHPNKKMYKHVAGPEITAVPLLTIEQATAIISCAKALNWRDETTTDYAGRQYRGTPDSPGSDWNKRGANIETQISESGWVKVRTIGNVQYWRRPAKKDGMSATLGHNRSENGEPLFYVFSTSTNFAAKKSYDSFGVYAVLNHGGDFSKAAKALRLSGYGKQEIPGRPTIAGIVGANVVPPPKPGKPMDFPLVAFPDRLAEFARTVAQSLSCPVDFPATAMIGAVATAIGATRSVKAKSSWTESARLYLACIAEPGSAKTPAQNFVMQPLFNKQTMLHDEFRRLKKEATDAGKSPPHYKHLLTTDATIEALANILRFNSRGIMFYADEISGWARGMGQYKQGKGGDRQFWLKAWSGGQHSVDRVKDGGEPMFIESPFVNVMGGIQPDMLSELSDEHGRQDGFMHRLLFSYPEAMPMSLWTDAVPDTEATTAWHSTIERLMDMKFQKGKHELTGEEHFRPRYSEFDPAGRSLFINWINDHVRETWEKEFNPLLLGPWSKMKSYALRLVLIVQMMRWASYGVDNHDVIDDETTACGLLLAEYFKNHAERVYVGLSGTEYDKKLRKAYHWIREIGGEVTIRLLMQKHFAESSIDAIELVNSMVRHGWGESETKVAKNGKDTTIFRLYNLDSLEE